VRKSTIVGAVSGFLAMATASTASAGLIAQFILDDHPDASQSPPPYGLRLDNFFSGSGGSGGVTTFSFGNAPGNVLLSVFDDNNSDRGVPSLRINISGVVSGGEDSGYGQGDWSLSMDYTMNVAANGNGWIVN